MFHFNIYRIQAITLAVLLMACLATSSAQAAQQGNKKGVPTAITAQNMQYDANGLTVLFTGKVHVKRPDFELWAEKMTVFLDAPAGGSDSQAEGMMGGMEAGDINRIVAEKNVVMKTQDRQGTCEKATYYTQTDKFVMEGNPVLKDSKGSTAVGHTITHFINQNKSFISSPHFTFYAPDKSEDPVSDGLEGGGSK